MEPAEVLFELLPHAPELLSAAALRTPHAGLDSPYIIIL